MALPAVLLPTETAKATQASLERKMTRLLEDQEVQSKALHEVSSHWYGVMLCLGHSAVQLQPVCTPGWLAITPAKPFAVHLVRLYDK